MAANETAIDVRSIHLFVFARLLSDLPLELSLRKRDLLNTASLERVLKHTILALLNEQRTRTLTSFSLVVDRARIHRSIDVTGFAGSSLFDM